VGYFTTNPTKLVLNFCDFSTICYAIYKKQPKHLYYLSYQIARRPPERNFALQCGPWGGRPARVEQIPASSSPAWPGKGGERVYGLLGFYSWLDWGRGVAGRAARRRPGVVAAAAAGPARWGLGWSGERAGELW
jgi:hypothetical protein